MYNGAITADQKKWQAEDDAYTLAQAAKIQKDPARMSAATDAAKRMAEEKREDANAMSSVARRKGTSDRKVKPAPKQDNISRKRIKKSVKENKSKFNVFQKI